MLDVSPATLGWLSGAKNARFVLVVRTSKASLLMRVPLQSDDTNYNSNESNNY